MSTLVIIGNGFDIWHGLPTSYKYFHDQCSRSLEYFIQFFDDFCDVDAEWANFEESLGSFNQDFFLGNATDRPSREEMYDNYRLVSLYEDTISFEKDELIQNITDSFNAWIASIKIDVAKKLIEIPNNWQFINFNYTTTLQDIYKVSNSSILHIHGEIRGEIIFGHGRSLCVDDLNDDDEPWFSNPRKDADSVYNVFRKPVHEIIGKYQSRLKSYGNITKIIIIGHSINDIDMPYFQCLLSAYPSATWQNYNYRNLDNGVDEVKNTHDKLVRLGVPEGSLTSSPTEDLKIIYPIMQSTQR